MQPIRNLDIFEIANLKYNLRNNKILKNIEILRIKGNIQIIRRIEKLEMQKYDDAIDEILNN